MIKSIIKEYGALWIVNRSLYAIKLAALRKTPKLEILFEKKMQVKRINLFEIDTTKLKEFLNRLPADKKNDIVESANKACNGIIEGFSSVILDYGTPIDWQLNPLTGRRCDEKKKWFQIPDFDVERGDVKVVWEISRFGHFIMLARAFLITNNRKYYKEYKKQLSEWLSSNPYSYGANYKCGQECSLRMVNALLAFAVFNEEGIADETTKELVADLVSRCYRKVLSNFFYAYRCIKNNHTISELVGMIVGAWCCDDEKTIERAYKLLDRVVVDQFMEDGGYKQYSFNYQRLALQDIECIYSIRNKTNKCLSAEAEERIIKSIKLMYQCQDASGDMPNYGSNDGALIFPLTSCSYRDFTPVISALFFMVTKRKIYKKGLYDEELMWLRGRNYADDSIVSENVTRVSSQYNKSGLYTLRNENSWMMIILNDYKSRPSHQDQLHIDLWIKGENVLCDQGTYSYASELGKKLTLNNSHNTVHIEGIDQMNSRGPFLIYDWTERSDAKFTDNSFCGTMKSKNGYEHTREITVNNEKYIIRDSVNMKIKNEFFMNFYTTCDVLETENYIELKKDSRTLCLIEFEGEYVIETAKRSLYYLKTENVKHIVVCTKNKVHETIVRIPIM